MANFNRNNRSGGGRNFGKRDFGGNRYGERPQMHDAVCSNCGKQCQVPFKPTGEKPVYCRDCFAKMNGQDQRGNFQRNNRDERPAFPSHNQDNHSRSADSQQFAEINGKLDKILELLHQSVEKVDESEKEERA